VIAIDVVRLPASLPLASIAKANESKSPGAMKSSRGAPLVFCCALLPPSARLSRMAPSSPVRTSIRRAHSCRALAHRRDAPRRLGPPVDDDAAIDRRGHVTDYTRALCRSIMDSLSLVEVSCVFHALALRVPGRNV
jgi:hypothetical protein